MRKLPVIQTSEASEAERPRWHWVGIGAGLVLTVWLPLLMIALWSGKRLAARFLHVIDTRGAERFAHSATTGQELALVTLTLGPIVLSYAGACIFSGALVARFGGRAGKREAALAGALSGTVACALAASSSTLSPWQVAFGAWITFSGIGASLAWLGAKIAQKAKKTAALPNG
ncbi:MAG TPA: hypothetical protein VGJ84_23880 [Polyangiaceae bacterium]